VLSDDGRARAESYCQWIRARGLPLDGFVLTEHRQFDRVTDYRKLEDESGLLILKGSEVETDYGHCLLFGVNADLEAAFDFARIDLPLVEVVREAERCGAIAVPCHPGRPRVGLCAHYAERGPVPGVGIVETLSGGSRAGEQDDALRLAEQFGYAGVGGSDAHIVSHIGRCATEFERPIQSDSDLVSALRARAFRAVSWS
jgi:predicted metal-dependent phosphoesterase TrpH